VIGDGTNLVVAQAGGKLIAEGTPDELRRQAGAGFVTLEDTFLALVESDAENGTVAA